MTQAQQLVVDNQRLVWAVIHKSGFRALDPAVSLDDLFQIGVIGLMKAATRYREGDTPFQTFAYTCIWREIAMYLRRYLCKRLDGDMQRASLDYLNGENGDPLSSIVPSKEPSPEDVCLTGILDFLVSDLREREPVLARVLVDKELTQCEAATLMGCSRMTVSRRLTAEKNRLKKILKEEKHDSCYCVL